MLIMSVRPFVWLQFVQRSLSPSLSIAVDVFQESSMSVDHLRFIMQSLPRDVNMTRRGTIVDRMTVIENSLSEMNRIVDEIETIAGDGNGQIYYDKFITLMRK